LWRVGVVAEEDGVLGGGGFVAEVVGEEFHVVGAGGGGEEGEGEEEGGRVTQRFRWSAHWRESPGKLGDDRGWMWLGGGIVVEGGAFVEGVWLGVSEGDCTWVQVVGFWRENEGGMGRTLHVGAGREGGDCMTVQGGDARECTVVQGVQGEVHVGAVCWCWAQWLGVWKGYW
jgi:hypothetical protein